MHKDRRSTAYLLVLLSFAILIFVTKNAYSELQLKNSEYERLEITLEDLQAKKERLTEIQSIMSDPTSDTQKQIARYVKDFSEEAMLNYFYDYAESTNGVFKVKSLTLDKKDKNEYGFKEGFVSLKITVDEDTDVTDFLDYILSEDAEYRFFIEKFNMPEKREWRRMSLNIPLKVFYK